MAVEKNAARLNLPISERDHWFGPPDAPVTLVEYGDLECNYCRKVNPIIRALRERLGNRLRYVFRHFPISSAHPNAQLAAEATEAAGAQGKFWEMYDYLFQHQTELDKDHLIEYARELGLDLIQFEGDLDEHKYAAKVNEDFLSGVRSGVNGTPTFFINGKRYDGSWDFESLIDAIKKPLGVQVRMVFQEFARIEASGGILLLISALLAILWANSPWAESYFQIWNTDLGITLGNFHFEKYLLKWINDGLMVVFFFVVGLEIKREVTTGELSSFRKALLPIFVAVGGMLVPAGLYLALNAGGPGEPGWGIPMATDIAFMLGILALFGSRIPFALKVFFTALAIADDLGAVLVIAIFYTEEITWIYLGAAALILVVLLILNWARVYSPTPYLILGIGLWIAFLGSGVHATIAGVLLAMTIPTRNPPDTRALLAQCMSVLNEFNRPLAKGAVTSDRHQVAAQTLENVADRMQSPAQKLEHDLLPWTTYVILPIFALANAGVVITFDAQFVGPVSLGIILGLVFGKPIGITLFSWIAVKTGITQLPVNVTWRQLFSASWLTGIGFTMALFIANSAFKDPLLLNEAKLGIMSASLVAGIIGYVLLLVTSPTHYETTHLETVPTAD
jgi:NhaA family Na+:H+ antiporter